MAITRIKKVDKENKKIKQALTLILSLFLFTGCAKYKTSWSCKNPEGIGCSSIGYADRIARKSILLNYINTEAEQNNYHDLKIKHKKLLINERYSDFNKQNMREVDFD